MTATTPIPAPWPWPCRPSWNSGTTAGPPPPWGTCWSWAQGPPPITGSWAGRRRRLGLDVLVVYGNFRQEVADGAVETGINPDRIFPVASRAEGARILQEVLAPGDWLLVKGSRSMHMEGLIDRLQEIISVGCALRTMLSGGQCTALQEPVGHCQALPVSKVEIKGRMS